VCLKEQFKSLIKISVRWEIVRNEERRNAIYASKIKQCVLAENWHSGNCDICRAEERTRDNCTSHRNPFNKRRVGHLTRALSELSASTYVHIRSYFCSGACRWLQFCVTIMCVMAAARVFCARLQLKFDCSTFRARYRDPAALCHPLSAPAHPAGETAISFSSHLLDALAHFNLAAGCPSELHIVGNKHRERAQFLSNAVK